MERRSKERKRQRLMASSYVSSRSRSDLPATFESLNDDTQRLILELVGNKSYAIYAGISKHCKEIYVTTKGMTKETFLYGYAPLSVIKDSIERFSAHYNGYGSLSVIKDSIERFSAIYRVRRRNYSRRNEIPFFKQRKFHAVGEGIVCYNRRDVLEWALQERKDRVLKGICYVAAGEERFDILDEVCNNFEDDEDYRSGIFKSVDARAAHVGKLEVLKWFETKGISINKGWCARYAARNRQLHIIQWLQEEKGLELEKRRRLYLDAIIGGHLHVMKWLREQEVDWDKRTFLRAVYKGNLNILQWLHDEGCPWLDDYRVDDRLLKPEVIDWCRTNGYVDRIRLS